MPKSRNDQYKRNAAQAINHLTQAVLDLNNIYTVFDKQREQQATFAGETGEQCFKDNMVRYAGYTERLKECMMEAAVIREQIIAFISDVWGLDEESIRVYLG